MTQIQLLNGHPGVSGRCQGQRELKQVVASVITDATTCFRVTDATTCFRDVKMALEAAEAPEGRVTPVVSAVDFD